MSRSIALTAVAIGVIGASAGAVVGVPWAIGGLVAGTGAGWIAGRSGMRIFVAIAITAGVAGGMLVGRGVVRALCLPGSCVELELVGAIVTGVGALVGVGLVVALVTRSFDEYHDAVAASRTPPAPGCEADEQPDDPAS